MKPSGLNGRLRTDRHWRLDTEFLAQSDKKCFIRGLFLL